MSPWFGRFIPHYFQIRADILSRVRRGELKAGDRIPSENKMAEQYGVSRPTVRQALDELVFAGFLRRERGRGTFLAPGKITEDLISYTPFVEEVIQFGMNPAVQIIKREILHATHEVANLLQVEENSPLIEITGLRTADEKPVTLRTSYYIADMFQDLLSADLKETTMFEAIRNRGYEAHRTTQTFRIVKARHAESKYLQVPIDFPLILWEGVLYSKDNIPFELTRAVYRSDRYEFRIEQIRDNIVGAGITSKKL